MNFSKHFLTTVAAMFGSELQQKEKIKELEGKIQIIEGILNIAGESHKISDEIKRSLPAMKKLLADKKQQVEWKEQAFNEAIELIPRFKEFYDHGMNLVKLLDAFDKEEECSLNERAISKAIFDYSLANAEFIELTDDPHKIYADYVKRCEEFDAKRNS